MEEETLAHKTAGDVCLQFAQQLSSSGTWFSGLSSIPSFTQVDIEPPISTLHTVGQLTARPSQPL